MFYRFRENREKRGKGGVKGLYFRGGKRGYFKALNSVSFRLICFVP